MEISKLVLHLQATPIGLRTMAISNMPGHIPSRIRCHWTCACIQCVRSIPVDCNPGKQLTWIRVNPVVLLCWKSCTLKGTDQVEYIQTNEKEGKYQPNESLPQCWRTKYNDIQQNPIYPTNTGMLLCGSQGTESAWSWSSSSSVLMISGYLLLQAAPSYERWSGTFQVP